MQVLPAVEWGEPLPQTLFRKEPRFLIATATVPATAANSHEVAILKSRFLSGRTSGCSSKFENRNLILFSRRD